MKLFHVEFLLVVICIINMYCHYVSHCKQKKVDPSLQVEVKPSIRARKIQEEKLRRQAAKEEYWRRRDAEERWRLVRCLADSWATLCLNLLMWLIGLLAYWFISCISLMVIYL